MTTFWQPALTRVDYQRAEASLWRSGRQPLGVPQSTAELGARRPVRNGSTITPTIGDLSVHASMNRIVEGEAAASGMTTPPTITINMSAPAIVNSAEHTETLRTGFAAQWERRSSTTARFQAAKTLDCWPPLQTRHSSSGSSVAPTRPQCWLPRPRVGSSRGCRIGARWGEWLLGMSHNRTWRRGPRTWSPYLPHIPVSSFASDEVGRGHSCIEHESLVLGCGSTGAAGGSPLRWRGVLNVG